MAFVPLTTGREIRVIAVNIKKTASDAKACVTDRMGSGLTARSLQMREFSTFIWEDLNRER